MKLRIRIAGQTCRVELPGADPSLTELTDLVREELLPPRGLSADTEFGLSLNGSELLSDAGQTLVSCGVVSGDLICVVLSESDAAAAAAASSDPMTSSPESQVTAAAPSDQPGGSAAPEASAPGPGGLCWEPMLCSEAEEGQAPLSLERLFHSAAAGAPGDAVTVVGHLLMLETGFTPEDSELWTGHMPGGWRSVSGVYKLQYSHPLCGSSRVMLVGVCMGPTLVIHGVLKVEETINPVRMLSLNPSSYVTDEWTGERAAAAFRNLSKLSRVFKDQLAYPLIAAAREAMALPAAFGLAALPPELLLRILRLLDVRSVVRLSSACTRFSAVTADSSLWRHLYCRDFTGPRPSWSRDTDWKELYIRSHKRHRECRSFAHHRSFSPFHVNPPDVFLPPPAPPLLPRLPPGIIGGEYDERPHLPLLLPPRPRHDPLGPPRRPDERPLANVPGFRPGRGRPADVRRGFI